MKKSTQVHIKDNKLIIHLPEADESTLWLMDLTQTSVPKGLWMKLKEEQGSWTLGVEKDAAGFQEIAKFRDKEKGVKALAVISEALFKGKKGGFVRNSLRVVGWGLGGVLTLMILFVLAFKGVGLMSSPPITAQGQYGIPLSADEVLTAPQ